MIWQFIGAILLVVIGIIGLCYCAWKDSDITIVSVIGFIMAFSGGCWLMCIEIFKTLWRKLWKFLAKFGYKVVN